MQWLAWIVALSISQAPANPCRNGSFEQLAPTGSPAHWTPLGSVRLSTDAHSGERAICLERTAEPPPQETGVNAANLDRLRGGMDFWYKATYVHDAALHIYVIPMGAEGMENTGSPRARFAVPPDHVGDGQWHHGRLKYDFTRVAAVHSVIFAARLEGTAGSLLLDDISYIEQVGPLLRVGTVRLEEDLARPGVQCRLSAPVLNAGDAPVKDVRVTLGVPAALSVHPTEPIAMALGDLAPDAQASVGWTLLGRRDQRCTLTVSATSAAQAATAALRLAPAPETRSFGPVSPVAAVGQPVTIQYVLSNRGTAALLHPSAEFALGEQTAEARAEWVPPGTSTVLEATFRPTKQSPAVPVTVRVRGEGLARPLAAKSSLVVGSAAPLPPPAEKLRASTTIRLPSQPSSPEVQPSPAGTFAILENEHLRLSFRRNQFGFGPGEIESKTRAGWKTVAWLPRLSRVVFLDGGEGRHDPLVGVDDARSENELGQPARLRFVWTPTDPAQPALRLSITFELAAGAKKIAASYELTALRPCRLLALEGPMVYALDRDEALYPGLEWLVGDEVSSGSLEIAPGHADRIRYVVHPNFVTIPAMGIHSAAGTVGLLWDIHQKWDGRRDRPSAVFASPDRFDHQRAHLMGLFLPTVPEFVPINAREAAKDKPYPLEAGKTLRLDAQLVVDAAAADALAAADHWLRTYGFPQPAPLPRGTYEREIQFSMQGYLNSLWVPQTKEWWTTKGGGSLSAKARPRDFVDDLLLGAQLSPDAAVRQQCRARADEVLAVIGGEPRRAPARVDRTLGDPTAPAALLAARDPRGAWRFDADQVGTGPSAGMDYHELGPDNAAELGTCAAQATVVLRYARITGDHEAYQQMVKTLEFMESFRVPRAAQVWEVPVHAPDILAAGEAVEAFVEAYRFSGEARWLRDAVTWARRGLPFVYLWNDPHQPFLVGASIPVFGATWMQGSWFGRPVQWNGLRYAEALLKLAEYDQSCPWTQIATTLIHSALHQQETAGENAALWPDNISAVDSTKCPWVFSPRMILANVLRLMGRDEEVATAIVGHGPQRIHVNAAAKITEASWDGVACTFRVTYPAGGQGTVVVFNVARPTAVSLDGQPLAPRQPLAAATPGASTEPGWCYEPASACLALPVPSERARTMVRIEGAAYRQGPRLPQIAEKIDFQFDHGPDGWAAANHIDDLTVDRGALAGRITAPDPYLVRSMLSVRAADSPVVLIRMRVTAGHAGQLYWATTSSPGIAEDKVLLFPLQADGQFHEYRLEVGKHPLWAGQTITAIRIDPGNGAAAAEFAIDYVRAAVSR